MNNYFPLTPLGVRFDAPAALHQIEPNEIHSLLQRHRLLVLPEVGVPSESEMNDFCARLGTVLEWEFGTVNNLEVKADSPNYLYTNREVPFHWDGAFTGRVPSLIFFSCETAPPAGAGGETTFSDATALLNIINDSERKLWGKLTLTYETEKVVHYGGKFTAPLVSAHPITGEPVVRFAEPVHDLNPVKVSVHGLEGMNEEEFFARMHELLNDPALCYEHRWKAGEVVIADNHALLHGRRSFTEQAPRRIRRINVL